MCHAEIPEGDLREGPARDEAIPLPDGTSMPAYLALPERGSGPGVLVVPDMYGRSPFYDNLARRVADLGYVALCPEPFHRLGPLAEADFDLAIARRADIDEPEMLKDLDTALTWLGGRPEVTSKHMAVIGFCMGGTFALNLAATRDDLASCCFYGFPAGSHGRVRVAAPAPLDVVADISGPLIGFWGEDDTSVGMDNVVRLVTALAAREVEFHCITYPHVGHGFMAGRAKDERTQDAARHAWVRMTAFLVRHLADA